MSKIEAARELLAELREVKRAVMNLIESENEDAKVFAIDTFVKLAEMEMALMDALGEKNRSEEKNPLARRVRVAD